MPPSGPVPFPVMGDHGPRAIVHPAGLDDLDSLAGLLADCFHGREGWLGWLHPFFRVGIYEDLRIRIRRSPKEYRCWTATVAPVKGGVGDRVLANELVGTIELSTRSSMPLGWNGGRYPYIANLAVRPDYRRQGIAKQLLLACEATARDWGFQDIYLHVLDDNQPARQLYQQLGYFSESSLAASWTWPLKRSQRLFLHKRLAA